ncbi:MAG: hypothetical protein DCC75_07320 [Proteobacteria bacterium]|nr:MAG: hypothetical protein DCC75_07320 [Pseudomonadota bacterium]
MLDLKILGATLASTLLAVATAHNPRFLDLPGLEPRLNYIAPSKHHSIERSGPDIGGAETTASPQEAPNQRPKPRAQYGQENSRRAKVALLGLLLAIRPSASIIKSNATLR